MADLSPEDLRRLVESLDGLTSATRGLDEDTIRLRQAQEKRSRDIEEGARAASNALGALAGAGMSAGKAMLEGQKGAAAFNSSLDGMAESAKMAGMALALMIPGGPVLKLFIAGVTAATTATLKYTQAANTMADQLHKGYVGLAKSGAAASDGMSGLYNDAKKLGLSMGELDSMVSLVGENAKELALFTGSVSEGRKKFADVGEAMEGQRRSLMNLGMTQQDLNEGTIGYIRLQTRMGFAQNMTNKQLADGAANYLKEMDGLAKLTGQSRKEMEQQQARALENERFQAKILELRNKGENKAADALMKMNSIYGAAGPEMQAAFQASVTGNLSSADAVKANLASNGEMIRSTQEVLAGRISETEAVQRTGVAMKNTADTLGTTLGQLGAYNNVATNLTETVRLGQLTQGDINKNYEKIKADQEKQLAGADKMTQQQTDLVLAQQKANRATEDFVKEGIIPAQQAMIKLAKLTEAGAKTLNEVTGKDKGQAMGAASGAGVGMVAGALLGGVVGLIGGPAGAALGAKIGAVAGAGIGGMLGGMLGGENKGGSDFQTEVPMAAEGGLLSGPKSGYLAMLHGTELVIPEDALQGFAKPESSVTAGVSQQQTQMVGFANELLKDTQAIVKLTDSDLNRTKTFSQTTDKYIRLKTDLMEDEIKLMEEQQDILKEIEDLYKKTFGEQKAKEMTRTFKMQRMSSSMGGMGGMGAALGTPGGGSGSQIMTGAGVPLMSGSGLPVMSGAGGGAPAPATKGAPVPPDVYGQSTDVAKDYEKYIQFTARTGSKENFDQSDPALKNAFIKAAEQYFNLTGKKMVLNSAFRDIEDQKRLWEESVKRGTPGVGPSGMPIANPDKGSAHNVGKALDIQNFNDAQAVAALNQQGLYQKIPSDPVHFTFEEGGIASGPNSGYPATLHGDEAIIPMRNNSGDFIKMFESMADSSRQMVAIMDEMLRAQKTSVDTQQKMLRMQS